MSTFNDILDFPEFQSRVVHYSTTFNFKDVLQNAAQNETWRDTTSQTLWDILEHCGKDINDIVSDSVINYIQNLADINTARIPALVSMSEMLATKLNTLESFYEMMPRKLQLLIDIFSIDREYLFGGAKHILSAELIRKLAEMMKVKIQSIPSEERKAFDIMALDDIFIAMLNNSHTISDEEYKFFLKHLFKTFFIDILTATYSPTDNTQIVDNLLYYELDRYLLYSVPPETTVIDNYIHGTARHPLDLEATTGTSITFTDIDVNTAYDSFAKQISVVQDAFHVSKSFDPWITANYIMEHGISQTHALTQNELILIEAILNAHNRERFDYRDKVYKVDDVDTRFAYYREKEFMDYIKAIIYIYHSTKNNIFDSEILDSGLIEIKPDDEDICALDLFNYVDEEWVYDDYVPRITENGLGDPIRYPIGLQSCEPHFIPRINSEFADGDYTYIMKYETTLEDRTKILYDREKTIDKNKPTDIIERVCTKLVDLVFNILFLRNRLKRQAQFNAMRGTGSLLAHAINDYLLISYPTSVSNIIPYWAASETYDDERRAITNDSNKTMGQKMLERSQLEATIQEKLKLFRAYVNVTLVEYMDTTEYFNIRPMSNTDVFDYGVSKRYWEVLENISSRDEPQLGVFSAKEIRNFYRNTLSMGSLHSTTEVKDDVEEFLISLYEAGATDVSYDSANEEYIHPIDDVRNKDDKFAYANRNDRAAVQNNDALREKKNYQFLRYTGNHDMGLSEVDKLQGMYENVNAYNWKNIRHSSVMLHPFLYTFQLWNPLVNIIINSFSSFANPDLEKSITNKYKFDDLFGISGETLNFWKYNILDYSGYMTRYESEKHSKVDVSNEVSPLTGYDGLFYPSAVADFVNAYEYSMELHEREKPQPLPEREDFEGTDKEYEVAQEAYERGMALWERYSYYPKVKTENETEDEWGNKITGGAYVGSIFTYSLKDKRIPFSYALMGEKYNKNKPWHETLQQVIASIYWQIEFWDPEKEIDKAPETSDNRSYRTFYGRWYSHLGYSRVKLQKIAKQLWYWRDRILDAATHKYAVSNYNLDIANNSFMLLDTFTDEDNPNAPVPDAIMAMDHNLSAIDISLDAKVSNNNNISGGYCLTTYERPKELWIRWNAEPLALPAFDVYWDSAELNEREFDTADANSIMYSPLGQEGQFEEFGQIVYKNSSTNDCFSDCIEHFLKNYHLSVKRNDMKCNKAPIFYRFQQSADSLVFAAWDTWPEQTNLIGGALERPARAALHILCKEDSVFNLKTGSTEYALKPFADDLKKIDNLNISIGSNTVPFLTAPYVFSLSRGSIIIPSYRIITPTVDNDEFEESQENVHGQMIQVRLDELICQTVNSNKFVSVKKHITYNPQNIFINTKNMFANSVIISKGTNVLFSVCDNGTGETKLAIAFLGGLTQLSREALSRNYMLGYTRYTADSDPSAEIALLRRKYYKAYNEWDNSTWDETWEESQKKKYLFTDTRIYNEISKLWNSFDRNDKYLCVIQFNKSLDEVVWNTAKPNNAEDFDGRLLNIISDASYIPNFAYQSPVNFEGFPDNRSGENRLYESAYMAVRDHWSNQLLGLENNQLLKFTKIAEDLKIRDVTEGVDTFINPTQVTEAIYRIWEQSDMDSNSKHIEMLYNPELVFDSQHDTQEWVETWKTTSDGKNRFLDKYITVLRTNPYEDGLLLNQKNWVLKTISVSELLSDAYSLVKNHNEDDSGYIQLSLDQFHSEAINPDGKSMSMSSYILVGTQNPFKYANDDEWDTKLNSPAYLLQYGNGIAGVRKLELKVSVDKLENDPEGYSYKFEIRVRFSKHDDFMESLEDDFHKTFMDYTKTIPAKSLMLILSEDDVKTIADYHMLTHHSDIFYNVPYPFRDEKLRADSLDDSIKNDPRLDKPNNPAKTFLDYLYVYEGSTAFKVNEQSERHGTYDFEHPINPLEDLLRNFRRNQVDLNCLKPFSTYVTQTENPVDTELHEISIKTFPTGETKVNEYLEHPQMVRNLIVDASEALPAKYETRVEDADNFDEKAVYEDLLSKGYRLHTWETNSSNINVGALKVFTVDPEDLDEPLKIYAYYQKVNDDSERGYHFDLFFNIQNLFKPPFEYMSSVTKQPAPVLLPNSYLYLDGSEESLKANKPGTLTLYVQLKQLVSDITRAVKTVPLVSYSIYNISDDKPKFFIRRISKLAGNFEDKAEITIKISDVYVNKDACGVYCDDSMDLVDRDANGVLVTKQQIEVIQDVAVYYDNIADSDKNRLHLLSFKLNKSQASADLSKEIYIDVKETKEFSNIEDRYPLRFNEDYQSLSKRSINSYSVIYTFPDIGYTSENMYVKWIIPAGIDVLKLYEKFGCLTEVGATECSAVMKDKRTARVKVIPGRIYLVDIFGAGNKYLGKEHGEHLNKYGFILDSASRRLQLSAPERNS